MRAWRLHEPVALENLRLDEVDDPVPGPDDVVVAVRAIGLNSSELQLVSGFWEGRGVHAKRTLPFIVGREAAGEVVAVGSAVRERAVGDRVLVHAYWPCGRCEHCRSGWENICPNRDHVGRNVPGAYAELIRLPARFALPLPEGVDAAAAAALAIAAGTAWHMLMVHAELVADETVLVVGGASGIGTAGIQVARLAGARVLATAGGPAKAERLRKLGAEYVVDHIATPDFRDEVLEATRGRGVDVVYDAAGGSGFTAGLASLRSRGRLIVGGYMGGPDVSINLPRMTQTEVRIIGSGGWTQRTSERVLELTARGALVPIIDSTFPFEDLRRGLEKLRSRDVFGKVLVRV